MDGIRAKVDQINKIEFFVHPFQDGLNQITNT